MIEQSLPPFGVGQSFGNDQQDVAYLDRRRLLRLIAFAVIAVSVGLLFVLTPLWLAGQIAADLMFGVALIAVLAVGCAGLALRMLRRDQVISAARVLLYGTVVQATLAVYLVGGTAGPVVVLYIFPVVAAGLLSKASDSLRLAGLVGAIYLAMALLEQVGLLRPVVAQAPALNYIFILLVLTTVLLLAFLTWQSSNSLARALTQVQEQSEALFLSNERLLEKNIQQVELGTELSASATQLQLASQQQASGATEQASAVSEVSTTTEELGSTASQIAQSSEQVAEAAQQTLENLSSGQDAVDESIQAMERIRSRMQDISERVLGLGERSQQIGDIIDLIDDISDETHLLALNAAIEAAGAGEHGRRFAVVAAEVKNLANRALVAAREVRGVIAEMRQATNSAVLAAEEGGKEVERGVDLAHRAGQVMDMIVMMAERTAQSAAEISLATAQQRSASEQVVETMREVADVARQSAAGARQMADSSATLTAIADRLHGIARYEM